MVHESLTDETTAGAETAAPYLRIPVGEQDLARGATALERRLNEFVSQGVRRIELDLEACRVVDSDGCRILVELRSGLDSLGGRLRLVRVPCTVRRLFQLARLEDFLLQE